MQVIKLHAQQSLTLSANTYYVPILDWKTGEVFVKRWYKELRGKQKIEYISLISIPDSHPVYISLTPATKTLTHPEFAPLSAISNETKAALVRWYEILSSFGNDGFGSANLPELVIGESLPQKQIKWTKRIKVLFEQRRHKMER